MLKPPGENSAGAEGFDGLAAAGEAEGDPNRLPPGFTVGVMEKIADLRFEVLEPSSDSSRTRFALGVDVDAGERVSVGLSPDFFEAASDARKSWMNLPVTDEDSLAGMGEEAGGSAVVGAGAPKADADTLEGPGDAGVSEGLA
jgi:hypothetical protein